MEGCSEEGLSGSATGPCLCLHLPLLPAVAPARARGVWRRTGVVGFIFCKPWFKTHLMLFGFGGMDSLKPVSGLITQNASSLQF